MNRGFDQVVMTTVWGGRGGGAGKGTADWLSCEETLMSSVPHNQGRAPSPAAAIVRAAPRQRAEKVQSALIGRFFLSPRR